MLPSKTDFLAHVRCLRGAAKAQGAELLLAADSMQAMIRFGGRFWVLYPRFIAVRNGVTQYVHELIDEVTHFAGWLPYRQRRWPEAADKLVFKRVAQEGGLRVPQHSSDPAATMNDVVVKRAVSSFGTQVHGPYRSSAERPIDPAAGEYYERFIDGRLLKLWCWGGRAVSVEMDRMSRVTGTGQATLRQLIETRARHARLQTPQQMEALLARTVSVLRYDGRALDDVLPRDERQRVEFRYGTDLMHPRDRRLIDLGAATEPRWQQLHEAARVLAACIPDELRATTIFTLDAVLDAEDRVWLLEMNCNPMVQPLVYPAMLASLLRPSEVPLPAETRHHDKEGEHHVP